jgi:hypothetical protein
MKYEFRSLNGLDFERLCGGLLAAEGFYHLRQFANPGQPDRGIDWIAENRDHTRWITQVKLFSHGVASPSQLRRSATDLQRGLALLNANKALLILSVPLTLKFRHELQASYGVQVWDANDLSALLDKHATVRHSYLSLVSSRKSLKSLLEGYTEHSTNGSELIIRLGAVPAGREAWREYENICIDILNYAFIPPLRPAKIQSKTEDGLDRRDAIYPIGIMGGPFWEGIKHLHSSRMVVAEFKNFAEPIGQREVESLQQYLLPKAKRSFGLLCSRQEPSDGALLARRRAWMTSESIILFLSDSDLGDLVRARDEGKDPSDILDAQMDDFFIALAP